MCADAPFLLGQSSPLQHLARHELKALQQRKRLALTQLAGDPVWEILLNLYAGQFSSKASEAGELADTVSLPHSTALRFLRIMEAEGLIALARHSDPMQAVVTLLEPVATQIVEYLLQFTQALADVEVEEHNPVVVSTDRA